MIRKILVPTDLSGPAGEAFRYAVALAEQFGASIDLLFVDTGAGGEWAPLHAAIRSGDLSAAEEQLAAHYASIARAVPLHAHVASGRVGDEILAQSASLNADMIIMGHAGEKQRDVMGSVTQAVIEKAETPVIAIPSTCSYRPIRHMVYATNFEHLPPDDSEQLLEMAALLKARLSCLHVERGTQSWTVPKESLFEVVYEQAHGQQVVQFYFTQSADIQKGIADFIQEQEGDMLIMMRRRHAEGLLKSLTSQMIQISQVPLLALHEKGVESTSHA